MLRRDDWPLQLGRPSESRSSSPKDERRSGVEKDESSRALQHEDSRGSKQAPSDDSDDSRSSDEKATSTHQATPLWASLGRRASAVLYVRRGARAAMRAKSDLPTRSSLGLATVLGMSC